MLLVGEAGLEACAGFLVGGARAHPLVGRAVSRGVQAQEVFRQPEH